MDPELAALQRELARLFGRSPDELGNATDPDPEPFDYSAPADDSLAVGGFEPRLQGGEPLTFEGAVEQERIRPKPEPFGIEDYKAYRAPENIVETARGGMAGLAESGYGTAAGASRLLGFEGTADDLLADRDEAVDYWGGNDRGRIAGRLTGDLAQFMVPGTALSKVPQAKRLMDASRTANIGLNLGTDVAVDAAIGAGEREASMLGLGADLFGEEGGALDRAADNPYARAAVESTIGLGIGTPIMRALTRGQADRGLREGIEYAGADEATRELVDALDEFDGRYTHRVRPPPSDPEEARLDRGRRSGVDVDTPLYSGFVKNPKHTSPHRGEKWFSTNPEVANQYTELAGAGFDGIPHPNGRLAGTNLFPGGQVEPAFAKGNIVSLGEGSPQAREAIDELYTRLREDFPSDARHIPDDEILDVAVRDYGIDAATPDEARELLMRREFEGHLTGGRLWDAEGLGNRRFEKEVLGELRDMGFDGVRLPDATFEHPGESVVIFDPTRSTRSQFDPFDFAPPRELEPLEPGPTVARPDPAPTPNPFGGSREDPLTRSRALLRAFGAGDESGHALNPLGGGSPPTDGSDFKPAVYVDGEVYTGRNHGEALLAAERATGRSVDDIVDESWGTPYIDLFQGPDGELLNRFETSQRFGFSGSENQPKPQRDLSEHSRAVLRGLTGDESGRPLTPDEVERAGAELPPGWEGRGYEPTFTEVIPREGEGPRGPRPTAGPSPTAVETTMPGRWYSRVETAIRETPMKRGRAEQWKARLEKTQRGTASTERGHSGTGIDDWLDAQEPGRVIEKDEVLDFLDQNRMRVDETVRGIGGFNRQSKYATPTVRRWLENNFQGGTADDVLWLEFSNDGDLYRHLMDEFPELVDDDDWADTVLTELYAGTATQPPKYANYKIPGDAQNYREVLLQHDRRGGPGSVISRDAIEQVVGKYDEVWGSQDEFRRLLNAAKSGDAEADRAFTELANHRDRLKEEAYEHLPDGWVIGGGPDIGWTISDTRNRSTLSGSVPTLREALERAKVTAESKESMRGRFKSQHWEEPNVLAHLRMSDREVFPPGASSPEPSIVAEEVQSDWHQKGRRDGYKDPRAIEQRRIALEGAESRKAAAWQAMEERGMSLSGARRYSTTAYGPEVQGERPMLGYRDPNEPDGLRFTEHVSPEDRAIVEEYYTADDELREARRLFDELDVGGVPDAPYKDTDEWVGLSMRRLLQEAADRDVPRITTASGRQSADMYDLRNQVSRITYDPEFEQLKVFDLDGRELPQASGRYAPEALPDVIGKDPARRLLDESAARDVTPDDVRASDVFDWISSYSSGVPPEVEHALNRVGEIMDLDELSYNDAIERFYNMENQGWDEETAQLIDQTLREDVPFDVQKGSMSRGRSERYHEITGDDLEVGGEGMMSFYDEIVPSVMRREIRRFGFEPEVERVHLDDRSIAGMDFDELVDAASISRPREFSRTVHTVAQLAGYDVTEPGALARLASDDNAVNQISQYARRSMSDTRQSLRKLEEVRTAAENRRGDTSNVSFRLPPELLERIRREGTMLAGLSPLLLGGAASMRDSSREPRR